MKPCCSLQLCHLGAGEANFLGGVAKKYGVKDFDTVSAKRRFFQIYIEKVSLYKSTQ